MNRFFVNPADIHQNEVRFSKDHSHQIRRVLRLKEGDRVEVLDDSGTVFQVRVTPRAEGEHVIGEVISVEDHDTSADPVLTLFFGMTSREKVEWILQKGTEIGVSYFQPFISARTLVQTDVFTPNKVERWKRIIREAAEQCERVKLPVFDMPKSLDDCLSAASESAMFCMLAWEEQHETTATIRSALRDYSGQPIGLFVGPKGGFSAEEVEKARKSGCQIVTLGERILRMETAALVFPAIVLYELHEKAMT